MIRNVLMLMLVSLTACASSEMQDNPRRPDPVVASRTPHVVLCNVRLDGEDTVFTIMLDHRPAHDLVGWIPTTRGVFKVPVSHKSDSTFEGRAKLGGAQVGINDLYLGILVEDNNGGRRNTNLVMLQPSANEVDPNTTMLILSPR